MPVLPVMRRCDDLVATIILLFGLITFSLQVSADQPLREFGPRLHLTDFMANEAAVKDVDFSPDGKTLTSLSFSGDLIFWNSQTGAVTQKWQDNVSCFRYSPDGKTIAIAIPPSHVQLRDAQTGVTYRTLPSPLPNHGGSLRAPPLPCLAWSPDGKMLAVGAGLQIRDGTAAGEVRLWDTQTGEAKLRIPVDPGDVISVAFAPDGRTVAVGSGGSTSHPYRDNLRLYDIRSGNAKRSLVDPNTPVDHIAFAPDGKTLLYTHLYPGLESMSGNVEMRDARTGALLWKESKSSLLAAVFSPDGQTVAAVGNGLRLMNAHTGQVLASVYTEASLDAVAFSTDGRQLAIGGSRDPRFRNTLQLWDARASTLHAMLIGGRTR